MKLYLYSGVIAGPGGVVSSSGGLIVAPSAREAETTARDRLMLGRPRRASCEVQVIELPPTVALPTEGYTLHWTLEPIAKEG